jgi:hypothetical protein
MHLRDRMRIVAYLAEIGNELNDLPPQNDLSPGGNQRLRHLIELRDSLQCALAASARGDSPETLVGLVSEV